MRVLVTGHRGYIGSVLTSVLRHARYDVAGLDSDIYRGCDFGRVREEVPAFDLDVRDVDFTDLLSFDAVVHLAGLPEHACENLDAALVHEINCKATLHLAECCKQAGVSRFIFASSYSVYGRGGSSTLSEAYPVNPTTAYARSKAWCERHLARLADDRFVPVFLRSPTIYGMSPRLRLDTLVNDFVASGVTGGRVNVRTSGAEWHPLVHVEDLARAYVTVLSAPDELVRNQVFNVGGGDEEYRIIDIADTVVELLPNCTRSLFREEVETQSLRVDTSKVAQVFPTLSFRWNLPLGIRQLRYAMLAGGLTPGEWRSDRFRRALRLARAFERHDVDSTLRPVWARAFASCQR